MVDAAGTVVPSASEEVSFAIEGDAELIGGNPIAAEAGIASVLVNTGAAGGTLRLRASAGRLQGEMTIATVEP